jgi:hypothetical protein
MIEPQRTFYILNIEGNVCKSIGFDQGLWVAFLVSEVTEKLLQIVWWEWDHETIKARFDSLLNIDEFLQEYTPATSEAAR